MTGLRHATTVAYVALTFLLTWAFWFGAGVIPGGALGAGALGIVMLYLGTFTPAFVAVAFTWRSGGRPGVKVLLAPLVKWDVGARWYVFAAAYLVVIKLAAAVLHRATVGTWPLFGSEPVLLMIGATLLSLLIFGQSGEEVGWRGFLLPRLADRIGYAWSGIIVGVVWAAWHLPLFLIPGVGRPGYSILLFTLQVTALSVAITWLYTHTRGSLWLTMLMHAAINNTGGIVQSASAPADDPWTLHAPPMVWIYAAVLWVPAIWFLMRTPASRGEPAA